jgi:hypothetical protein
LLTVGGAQNERSPDPDVGIAALPNCPYCARPDRRGVPHRACFGVDSVAQRWQFQRITSEGTLGAWPTSDLPTRSRWLYPPATMASSPTSSLVRSKQIPSGRATTELDRAARDLGAQLAAESADRRKPSQSAPDARLLLTDHGYEPYDDEGTIRLRNCPFAQLAKRHGELVCRANLVFVEGLLQGRQHRGLQGDTGSPPAAMLRGPDLSQRKPGIRRT